MLPPLLTLALDHPATAASFEPLIPLAPAWVTGFLLLLLWLFVAAILLGPLVRHYRLEPRSWQLFSDDRFSVPRRP